MGKYNRKISRILLFCMLVCVSCGMENMVRKVQAAVSAEEKTVMDSAAGPSDRSGTDVVLVMDESGSMKSADPGRLAIEGAKLFVDMEKISGISLALVSFPIRCALPE